MPTNCVTDDVFSSLVITL